MRAVLAKLSKLPGKLWAKTSFARYQKMDADFLEIRQLTDAQLCEIYDRVLTDDAVHHDYKRRLCYIMATRLWARWRNAENAGRN